MCISTINGIKDLSIEACRKTIQGGAQRTGQVSLILWKLPPEVKAHVLTLCC